MPIIKPTSSNPPTHLFRVEDLDAKAKLALEDARKEADRIVAAARAEAARVLLDAEAERKAAAERGFNQGLEAGVEKGRAEGREAGLLEARAAHAAESARVQAAVTALEAALVDAGRRAVSGAEAAVIRLALAIATSVVKREVALDEDAVRGNVAAAVGLAARRSGVEVRVNPADRATVDRYLPDLVSRMEGLSVALLVADPTVGRGGCRVVTPEGTVDADIAVQLREIERALLGNGEHP